MKKLNKKTSPKKSGPKMINLAAAVGFGALAGAGATYMFSPGTEVAAEEVEEETTSADEQTPLDLNLSENLDLEAGPSLASLDASNMTFQEAWDAAREEVGAGGIFLFDGGLYSTLTNGEWEDLSPDEHATLWNNLPSIEEVETNLAESLGVTFPAANEEGAPSEVLLEDGEEVPEVPEVPEVAEVENNVEVIVYENAPAAFGVDDDMNFSEAFATAREEVGAGGVFMWNGQMYGTYYETESASMTEDDRAAWTNSIPSLGDLEENIALHQGEMPESAEAVLIAGVEEGEGATPEEVGASEEVLEEVQGIERSSEETEDPFADLEGEVMNTQGSISAVEEDIFDPEEDIKMDDSFLEEQGEDHLSYDDDFSNDDDIDDFV